MDTEESEKIHEGRPKTAMMNKPSNISNYVSTANKVSGLKTGKPPSQTKNVAKSGFLAHNASSKSLKPRFNMTMKSPQAHH